MKRITVFSLLATMFFSFIIGDGRVIAQSAKPGLPTARPEQVGMSAERLARIRTAMQRYVDRGLVPGVVTLVARRGRVVNFDAIGYRDVESKAPMTTDTIFRIASMTKPIASVGLMMLYEEGHFQQSIVDNAKQAPLTESRAAMR